MMPKVSEQAIAEYDAVAAGLESAGVVRGSMFGMPCLKIGKKVIAGMFGDAMTFKLPPRPREKALALPGVRGLVVGRTLLYPPDGDVAGAVDVAAGLVHRKAAA